MVENLSCIFVGQGSGGSGELGFVNSGVVGDEMGRNGVAQA